MVRRGCTSVAFILGLTTGLILGAGLVPGTGSGLEAQEVPAAGIEFVTPGAPGLATIYLRGVGTDDPAGLLRVEVWANEVRGLYAVSFALQFPEKHFKFPKARSTAFVEGPFLGGDGAEETVLAVRQNGKEIIVGHTRTREAQGVSGSGLLMSFEFRGLGVAGNQKFRFRRRNAFDSSGAAVPDYSWLSGKAVITIAAPEPSS